MGFGGPAPADRLAALYDTAKSQLILYAEGEVQDYTYGFKFNRLPWAGGLKFSLTAWSGPIAKTRSHYQYHQAFDIKLPNPVTPSGKVIITYAGNLKGALVPIRFTGLRPPPKDDTAGAQPTGTQSTLVTSTKPDDSKPEFTPVKDLPTAPEQTPPLQTETAVETIYVRFGRTFTIKESAQVPSFGSINLSHDDTHLEITTAGIEDKNILWTFRPRQTGHTEVTVTVHGGIAAYILTRIYNVVVTPFLHPPLPKPGYGDDGDEHKIVLPIFTLRVQYAQDLVRHQYPKAELLQARAAPVVQIPVHDVWALASLSLIFQVEGGTARIDSLGWFDFGPITFVRDIWVGPIPIRFPGDVPFDLVEAAQLVLAAGYKQPFNYVTLEHPLNNPSSPNPGVEQAYYIFALYPGPTVWVGLKDKKVYIPNAPKAAAP